MQNTALSDWEKDVESLVRSKGGTASARDFQKIVNVVFHDAESNHYDDAHEEIWSSAQPVFEKLCSYALSRNPPSGLVLDDVGCGTGAATDFILRTKLSQKISRVCLIDTSSGMLQKAKERSTDWPIPATTVLGELATVESESADILITSSVLHHIVDLEDFCGHIRRVLRPKGFYLHLFDPPKLNQPAAAKRAERLRAWQRKRHLMNPTAWFNKIRRLFSNTPNPPDYVKEANNQLIADGIIKHPLTAQEMWSITDLHAPGLPHSLGDSISPDDLKRWLDMEPIGIFTYGYFGVLSSNLPPHLVSEDAELFAKGDMDGGFLAGAWQR